MIRIVASGDQHVDARHMGGELALLSQEVALDELMTAAARANVLLLLGDLTHTPRPSARAFAMWGKAIAKAQRENGSLEIIAIAGNHEQDQVVGVFPYFGREQIRAITIPQIVSLEFHSVGYRREENRARVDIACLPWLPDSHVRAAASGTLTKGDVARELTDAATKILRGFLAQRREGVPMILATHATIEGAETSSGWNMGYRPSTGYILEGAELDGFAMVLAGHIHKHQSNGDGKTYADGRERTDPSRRPVIYSGSLTPLDFSETEAKGYIDATIELEKGDVSWKFEPLTNYPPKVGTLEKTVTDERGRGVLEALLSSYAWPTYSRFRLTCDEQTAREFPAARIRAAMLAAGARMAQVELTVIRADRVRDPSLTDDLSPMTALEKYLEGRDVDAARIRELAKSAIADAVIDSGANGVGGDLRLTRLEAENFLGLASADVALDGGISTLFGPVGMGKSSTGCDLIRFALFGESRIGGKSSERLIRQGADQGFAAVELEGPNDTYRIVRTLKRGSAGRVATTLDVLDRMEVNGPVWEWHPLSSGKIADGEAEISRILGGLTDDVLAVANLVVQRDADRFSAARPEERKRLIARAAGLDVFDTLASASRIRLTGAESQLRELHSAAQPLRDRADVLPRLEGDLVTSQAERDASRAKAADLERQRIEISEDIELFRGKVAALEAVTVEYRSLDQERENLELDRRTWDSKRDLATAVLEDKPKLETAQANLDETRERIVLLEAQVVADNAALTRRAAASSQKSALELQLAGMRQRRLALARELGGKLDNANAQKDRLKASECPVIEKIDANELAPCRFLRDAVVDASLIGTMEKDLEKATEEGDDEAALISRILDFPIPDAPNTKKTIDELALERTNARKLEALIAGADRIARADQVVLEHTDATKKIDARLEELAPKITAALVEINKVATSDPRVDLRKRTAFLDDVDIQLAATRKDLEAASQRVGILEGRIETMREAKAELELLQPKISDTAQNIAGWNELVMGWKACRVAVLENNVIPSLEDLANEVLRQFPYGIQVALNTQRDRKSGEGVSETLEIEVLGAGQVYELCSGGQKTTIDLAFHVAIALLVSRRISTRLRFLYLDEPEGLDEPGRIALAGLVRWIHDTHALTVILASHHEDLIDAVGGERIPFAGEPGNATVGAAHDD